MAHVELSGHISKLTRVPYVSKHDKLAELLRYFQGRKIGLDGTIAAAKTTTGQGIKDLALSNNVLAEFYPETFDKEKLAAFYASVTKNELPSPAANALQWDTFSRCGRVWKEAELHTKHKNGIAVLDRTLWGNALFAAMHRASGRMSREDYEQYLRELESRSCRVVDYLVYLDVDPVVAHHRAVVLRARPEEKELSLDYMYTLERASFLHVYHCLGAGINIIVVRNDVFRTPQELLTLIRDAPKKPYDVSSINGADIVEDPRKIRGFFAKVGEYCCRGQ